jgi:putative ABC transport system ATP-binding protein
MRSDSDMSGCGESPVIETKNLVREIFKNGNRIRTVDSISFIFDRGDIYNIVGPSGAGKSSFLRLLNRLDEPSRGEVLFYGKPLPAYQPTALRKKVSLLFQTPYLFPGTVKDNIQYCCDEKNIDDVNFHLERVGLRAEFTNKDVDDLSVGERQRVAIARSLVQKPEVLLLDEPTSALDPTSARKIEELVVSLAKELYLTVIIVTHNPEQALRLGGKTLLLVGGKLIESGETQTVLTSPATELGKSYINKELA